jgi:hypothetical protein
MSIQTNDKINIKYGDNDLPFIGLEESLKEYNEENINTIISNVLDLLDKKKMSQENYYKIWNSQHQLLKQDYGFSAKEGSIVFELTFSNFHRNNKKLMEFLNKYIKYIFKKNEKKNVQEFIKPKEKKSKEFKDLEGKSGIKETDVDISINIERNIDNLLVIIANNRQNNEIKFK